MIVLVSLIVLLRGFPCFHDFSHGASLHPYSFNRMTFCTCMYRFDHGRYALLVLLVEHTCHDQTYLVYGLTQWSDALIRKALGVTQLW